MVVRDAQVVRAMTYVAASDQVMAEVLGVLSRKRPVFAPVPVGNGQYRLEGAAEWEAGRHTVGPYRTVEPLKELVFPPREFLGKLWAEEERNRIEERMVVGVKNCDLSALRIHDYVFRDSDPEDPRYTALRRSTLIVSADCMDCLPVCFCPAVGEQPYPKGGFDINLSRVGEAWLVEAGSEKGDLALAAARDLMEEATAEMVRRRDDARQAMHARVERQARESGLVPGSDFQVAFRKSFESDLWADFARDCVECGACNFVCGTCHCFMLGDGYAEDNLPARVREWDSCLFRNFARVAGGANPREHRAARLRNRFDKKFNFFVEVLGAPACGGCGRCIEACMGKIDIREVLRRMQDEG